MKILYSFPVICVLISSPVDAQVVVTPGTQVATTASTQIVISGADLSILSDQARFGSVDLILNGTKNLTLSSGPDATNTTPFPIHGIIVEGGAEYTLKSSWEISNLLTLTNGKLIVTGTGDQLTYAGVNDVAGSDASYVIGPFLSRGTGARTFPIGTPSGYFPVRLDNVEESTAVMGFEVVETDPLITTLPEGVTTIMTDRYWKIFTRGNGFTGSPISVSTNQLSTFLLSEPAGDAKLLEVTLDPTTNVLPGLVTGDFLSASQKISTNGDKYAIGKGEKLSLEILNVLTPNGDVKNNVLRISNIELFPQNIVTLMDRYGVVVHTWNNFKNYDSTDAKQQEFDFTSLAIGNYLCVVQYTRPDGSQGSQSQMITVLK